jgi:hypothetical protein
MWVELSSFLCIQMSRSWKWVLLLYEFFFVYSHQMSKSWKWLITQFTFKWFYFHMSSFLCSQISRSWKLIFTQIPFKWCYHHMSWIEFVLCIQNSRSWKLLIKSPDFENNLSHKSHLNELSPVWILLCYASCQIVKINAHTNHILMVLPPYELNWVCFVLSHL